MIRSIMMFQDETSRVIELKSIEIASCRHSIAQKAVNMFQGELYGYLLYIQKNFMAPNKVKFF